MDDDGTIGVGAIVTSVVRTGKFNTCNSKTLNITEPSGTHNPGTIVIVLTTLNAPQPDENLDVMYTLSAKETSWSFIDISGRRSGVRFETI